MWNAGGIDTETRCIVTVVVLMSSGITDSSLKCHLENAKARGVRRAEIAAIITHTTMYVG
ncbi:carboxymuconolactone decarboxylase family protein [Corynebacterium pyruviciproducens]|uniref:carboxymuconolactone decarboxylase family protein n=1 Tax=Corynebacterium pyruviciproducens TaxID=598660 RepID=UPI00254E114A|nr:carboxymuconolactone decarboxylase family protein [Corynebacterium pyruviciproducens]MDK6567186.1 carboxymuconolactone decarboxylase family protein [Corynebacterium pyruviciproducens]